MPSVTWLARDVAAKVWPVVTARFRQGSQWLITPRDPITWAALRAKPALTTLPLPRTNGGRLGVGVLLLLALLWYASGQRDDKGVITYPHASLINPILGGLGALFLIYAAIRQAETARKQAQIAADRHEAQTEADRQRRITESFSKAVEQLGNDKVEIRVGGIFTLERLANEALSDKALTAALSDESWKSHDYQISDPALNAGDFYWTVMETLTAFVRGRASWKEQDRAGWETAATPNSWESGSGLISRGSSVPVSLPTDIAAALAVVLRRPEKGRTREQQMYWGIDLSGTDLRGANFNRAQLKRAVFTGAQLKHATFSTAQLESANFTGAWLDHADFTGAELGGGYFKGAHLRHAVFRGALLAHVDFTGSELGHSNLGARIGDTLFTGARLEGADLSSARFESYNNLTDAVGDAKTRLPDGFPRPAHWPPYEPD